MTGTAELIVTYTGGWSIIPPVMPAMIGRRSEAPRVLAERLDEKGRYTVSLEGLAGRTYSFRVRVPDAATGRSLAAETTPGSAAVIVEARGADERGVTVTFPATGANADGYTQATISLGSGASPRRP